MIIQNLASLCQINNIQDIDCPATIAGTDFIKNLGLARNNILQTEISIGKINEMAIDIISAVLMEMKAEGRNMVIKQIVYIASNTNKVFLSRTACEQLGLISDKPPGMELELNHAEANSTPETKLLEGTAIGREIRIKVPSQRPRFHMNMPTPQ